MRTTQLAIVTANTQRIIRTGTTLIDTKEIKNFFVALLDVSIAKLTAIT